MKRILTLLLLSFMIFGLTGAVFAGEEAVPDPLGAKTLADNPQAPVDYVWVLVCGFLVMFMQAGFAMVETGFCRAKNATNLMAKNTIDFTVGSLAFFVVGYTFLKGADVGGIIGSGPLF
jgi:Amt family ammonium transporter